MADTKITALTAITTVDPAVDVFPIVDVSDTTMAASGTTKKITSNQLLGAGGTATLASATITGDLTVRTTGLTVNSSGVGVGTSSQSSFLGNSPKKLVIGDGTQTPALTLYGGTANVSGIYYAKGTVGNQTYRGFFEYDHSVDALAFGIAGTTAMTLNSTGLGVGGSPSYKVSAIGTTNNQVILHVGNTAGSVDGDTTNVVRFAAGSGANALWANARYDGFSHAWRCNSTTTEAMVLNSSGNVGVGVTPSAWSVGKAIELSSLGAAVWSYGNDNIYLTSNAYFNGGFKYASSSKLATNYTQFQGTHQWNIAPSGTAGNAITFTQAMTLDVSGNLLVGVTSANASGGVLQLKSGITFPATQVASSDANTLDDYEEGTWSPTPSGGVNLTSQTSVSARYTKIGRLVTVSGYFTATVTAANTDTYFVLPSLPFVNGTKTAGSLMENAGFKVGTTQVDAGNLYGFFPSTSALTTGAKDFYYSITYSV